MPSPICKVNGVSTVDGVDVAGGSTVTIALSNAAGVMLWTVACVGCDEENSVGAVNDAVTLDSVALTATFVMPNVASGGTLLFESVVNAGKDVNGTPQDSYRTRFGVFQLGVFGLRVGALNETTEGSAEFGWTKTINTAIRLYDTSRSATSIVATVSGFGGSLSVSDTTVQHALDTLDDHGHAAGVGLAPSFKVDSVATSANVTAANLNTLTGGGETTLHSHSVAVVVSDLRLALGTSARYDSVATLPEGALIYDATLVVATPYSAGTSILAFVDSGLSQTLLLAGGDIDPKVVGVYTKSLHLQVTANKVSVQVRGAPATGAAHLLVRYTTMPTREDSVTATDIDRGLPMAVLVKTVSIINDSLATPPTNPQPLDCYRVPTSPQGAWSAITVGNLVSWDEQIWQDLGALSAKDRVVVAPSGRTPAGSFAAQGGKYGTWSGSVWAFVSPANSDVAVVIAANAPDSGTLYVYCPDAWWTQNGLSRVTVGNATKSAVVAFAPVEVQTTDATVTTVTALTTTPSINSHIVFDVLAQAIKSDGSVAVTLRRSASFRRGSSAPVLIGSAIDNGSTSDSGGATWNLAFNINTNAIETQITGQAATSISWTVALTVSRRTI